MLALWLTLALGAGPVAPPLDAPTPAPADRAPAEGPAPLEWDPRIDLPVTGVLFGACLGTELAKPALAPAACRW
jgi:hypothetical protein